MTIDLERVQSLRATIEKSLPPNVLTAMHDAGVSLTLGVSSSAAFQPVVVDPQLADELATERELTADVVSYRKNVTGVDHTIFISVAFPRRAPRIKVAIDPPTHIDPSGKNASVTISDGKVVEGDVPARLLDQVCRFIEINRDVLLEYWDKRLDTDELRQRLKKI